jgi:hypothetical protein
MLKASPFRDLGKANELATKNFLSNNSFSVITETKADDVSFKSTVSGDKTKGLSAVVEPKWDWKVNNIQFEGRLSTANTFSAKGTYKNVVPDLNVSVQLERAFTQDKGQPKETNILTPGFSFNNSTVNFTTDLKVPISGIGKIAAAVALHGKILDNASVGVKVDYEHGGNYSVESKVLGSADNVEGAFIFNYPSKVWGLHLWHLWSTKLQVAASLTVPPSDDKKNPNPSFVLAESYRFDDSTTVKGRLQTVIDKTDTGDHAFRAGLSLAQKVNDNTTVTIGADINLNQALGLSRKSVIGAESSCGFQINFK